MAWRLELSLDDAQERELEQYRDHDPRPYVRERCAAMLKIADGKAPYWVARNGLLKQRDPDTVYSWLKLYQAEGVLGLVGHAPGGRHGRRLRSRAGRGVDRATASGAWR